MQSLKQMSGARSLLTIDNRAFDGTLRELPTATCVHCNAVVVLHPRRKRDRGVCRKCMGYICDRPGCVLSCTPLKELCDLAIRYPTQPWLERGPNGEFLFDERLRDRHKVY